MISNSTSELAKRLSFREIVCHQRKPDARWHPVVLSSSAPKSKIIGQYIRDGRVVVYRGGDGLLRAMSAISWAKAAPNLWRNNEQIAQNGATLGEATRKSADIRVKNDLMSKTQRLIES